MRVRLGRLGCWPGTRFESRAVARWLLEEHGVDAIDRESAGLAEAATELDIPWSVLGPCNPLDDPYQAARNTRRGHDDAQAPLHRLLVSILNAVSLGRAPIP